MSSSPNQVRNSTVYMAKDPNFLTSAQKVLSRNDLLCLSEMIDEWHEAKSLSSCIDYWSSFNRQTPTTSLSYLQTLFFNVRGFESRWNEVISINSDYQFDIIVLAEVGKVDFTLLGASFPTFRHCYQADENAFGGVIILVKNGLPFSRVKCSIPNICAINLHLDIDYRIIGVYAPWSKSWT